MMIIESSFLKLPELLISNYAHGDIYESTIVHFMSLALNMELNSRNIPKAYEYVFTEKPFLSAVKNRRRLQADLYLVLKNILINDSRNLLYGVREKNWIEVKAYLGSTRNKNTEPKTIHAGKIIRDILRLCVLPEESQGRNRDNSRYLLQVFSDEPRKYIAFSDITNRGWIKNLFKEGISEFEINLANEANSLKKAIGSKFFCIKNFKMCIKVKTIAFYPDYSGANPIFYGYLNRIFEYKIEFDDLTLCVNNKHDDYWSADKINNHNIFRDKMLKYL
jgi:hypothetical protein